MPFIEPTLSAFLEKIRIINDSSIALWGEMSAQRMIEHLSDSLKLSIKDHQFKQLIPEDKVAKAQNFLNTEHPMPKNFKVEFATPGTPLRTANIDSAIKEFEASWKDFETFFNEHPNAKTLHPNFGHLSHEQWLKLHSKHFTHHLEQFGING
jgi:hypothetical protein